MKIEMSAETKYFSINENVSNYVQKYIVPRKRKMFTSKGNEKDFLTLFKTHKKEKFLFPCSDIRKSSIPNYFTENGFDFSECIIYRTVIFRWCCSSAIVVPENIENINIDTRS